jgi:hypothetical protein
MEYQVIQEHKDFKDHKDQMDLLVYRVGLGHPELQDFLVCKDLLELQDLLELLVLVAHLGHQGNLD